MILQMFVTFCVICGAVTGIAEARRKTRRNDPKTPLHEVEALDEDEEPLTPSELKAMERWFS